MALYSSNGTLLEAFLWHGLVRDSVKPPSWIVSTILAENITSAVHIFDFPSSRAQFSPRLRSVLLHARPILHARWNPVRKGSLALCTGGQSVYTWSDEWVGEGGEEEMAECIGIPGSTLITHWQSWHICLQMETENFETRDLKWAPDGKGIVLLGRDQFCCAFEVEEE